VPGGRLKAQVRAKPVHSFYHEWVEGNEDDTSYGEGDRSLEVQQG